MILKEAGYYGNLNTALLGAIPASVSLVLEIGCGDGRLGAALKARTPECRVYGAEIHPGSAATAATHLDLVLCGAAETMDFDFLQGEVDCLVYGDVLEHLLDPWAILRRHRDLLTPHGCVVASIPNVQHWSLLEHLLQGHWTYADHGLLDDTHLRFFTLDSITDMFEQAGLAINRTIGLHTSPQHAAELAVLLGPLLSKLDIDPDRFKQTTSPLQYVVTATRR